MKQHQLFPKTFQGIEISQDRGSNVHGTSHCNSIRILFDPRIFNFGSSIKSVQVAVTLKVTATLVPQIHQMRLIFSFTTILEVAEEPCQKEKISVHLRVFAVLSPWNNNDCKTISNLDRIENSENQPYRHKSLN